MKQLPSTPQSLTATDEVKKIHVVNMVEKTVEKSSPGPWKLLFCFIGIFVCYLNYGLLQEKITRATYVYGDQKETFVYPMALVFMQCIINALFVKAVMKMSPGQHSQDTTATKWYCLCSMSYVGAMFASNASLQHVSYPTQVLGKSVKPIPVMILGVLVGGKRYKLLKYLFITLIVAGVAMFMWKDKSGKALDADHTLGMGEMLLIISLGLDGLTGGFQDRMRKDYQTQGQPLMLNLNLWSMLWLFLALIFSGQGVGFFAFATRHPYVLKNMFMFGVLSALGQHFIFMTVANFGALTCSVMTTTRKFFSILGSVLIYRHPMSSRQYLGTMFVFSGLILDALYGR